MNYSGRNKKFTSIFIIFSLCMISSLMVSAQIDPDFALSERAKEKLRLLLNNRLVWEKIPQNTTLCNYAASAEQQVFSQVHYHVREAANISKTAKELGLNLKLIQIKPTLIKIEAHHPVMDLQSNTLIHLKTYNNQATLIQDLKNKQCDGRDIDELSIQPFTAVFKTIYVMRQFQIQSNFQTALQFLSKLNFFN